MSLPELDTALFFLINKDLQNSFFDRIMPFITSYAFLVFSPFLLLLIVKEKKNALPAVLAGPHHLVGLGRHRLLAAHALHGD